MHPSDSAAAARSAQLEEQIDRLNEAARWLEEHSSEAGRKSDILILPPAVVPRSRRSYAFKRVFDFFVALIGLAILAPFMVIIAVIVRLDSPGWPIFAQKRVGEGGVLFTCYKFRSMRSDSDDRIHREMAAKFLQGETVDEENGQKLYKMARDPRVTHVGHLLRATSLDELPQLVNVLRGEMSLVGPRPALSYEVEQYRYRHRYRLLVKPGITGIWQVYGRSIVDFETLVSMDLHYVTDGTMWLDLKLILLTFLVIFKRSGR